MNGLQQLLPSIAWVREHSTHYINDIHCAARQAAVHMYEQRYHEYVSGGHLAPLLRTHTASIAWHEHGVNVLAEHTKQCVAFDGAVVVMNAAAFMAQYPVIAARTIAQENLYHDGAGWVQVAAQAVAHEHLVMYIRPGVTITQPVSLHDVCAHIGNTDAAQRISIIVGEGAHVTLSESESFHTPLRAVYVWVETHAQVHYYAQQSVHVHAVCAEYTIGVKQDAQVSFFWTSGESTTSLVHVRLLLLQQGAQALMRAGLAMMPHNVAIMQVHQEHRAPHTTSDVVVRGALADSARTIYHGMIAIDKGMAGVDAQQEHKALLLGKKSRADALPMLQVQHHEVRCGHGSAVGVLDHAQLTYLQMRGFTYTQARRMVVEAFFAPVASSTVLPMVNRVLDMVP